MSYKSDVIITVSQLVQVASTNKKRKFNIVPHKPKIFLDFIKVLQKLGFVSTFLYKNKRFTIYLKKENLVVSKPLSKHIYKSLTFYQLLSWVYKNPGMSCILTTPLGLLCSEEAIKLKVGGIFLFAIK